jgi:hypothetical protein
MLTPAGYRQAELSQLREIRLISFTLRFSTDAPQPEQQFIR